MAILPNPEELTRVAPRPSRTVAGYQPGIEAEANTQLGNKITALAEAETQRLDAIMADDAETKLMAKELELQQEYSQIKGEGVLKPDFHQSFQDKYKAYKEEISRGLSTPAQRNRFETTAGRRAVGFDAHRVSYAMGEAERFKGVQHESRIKVLTDTAIAQYANPAAIAAANLQLNDEIVKWGVEQGMSDPDIAAAYSKKVNGNFYSALIEKALANDAVSTANILYAASSSMLSQEQDSSISRRLKIGNAFAIGGTLVEEAKAALDKGVPLEQVEMDLVKKAKTHGAEAYQAAQVMFGNVLQARDRETKENYGRTMLLYEKLGSKASLLPQIMKSEEFSRLSPSAQENVINAIKMDNRQDISDARSASAERRAAINFSQGQADRKEEKALRDEQKRLNSPEMMAKFNAIISDRKGLKALSEEALWGMTKDIGLDKVRLLAAEHAKLNKGVASVKLDPALVKQGMPPEGFKNKQTAAAYEGTVKTLTMEWEAQNPGKKPTLEESKAIIRAANTEYNISSKWFNNDYTMYDEPPTKEKHAAEAAAKRDIIRDAALKGKTLTTKQIDEIYVKSLSIK